MNILARSIVQPLSVRIILVTTCLVACALFYTPGVYAKNIPPQGSFRVEPAFIEVDVSKDFEAQQIPIRYSNLTDSVVDVELTFFPVTFADDERMTIQSEPSTLVSHILPSTQSFVVAPMETKTVLLSFQNLDLLSSSDYYEALSATINVRADGEASQGASIYAQITTVLLVHNTASNRHPVYSFAPYQPILNNIVFSYPANTLVSLSNTGNTYGIPRGTIQVNDVFGRLVASGSVNPDSVRIFPQSTRLVDITMNKEPVFTPIALARYELALYDQHAQDKGSISDFRMFLFIDPLFLILTLVFASIFVLFLMYVSRIRTKKN